MLTVKYIPYGHCRFVEFWTSSTAGLLRRIRRFMEIDKSRMAISATRTAALRRSYRIVQVLSLEFRQRRATPRMWQS